ncbi:hypothetical protein DERP_001761 [Dermatophagoides pteronyssinus]|uniref:Uncharacterized protein n=1 Tax=Dermatophagoides pteronyssinus TaxID=6956 RepID=A0ABQ8JBZ7_DERPT|nr:hypothetical protein DERP_001761 [Dermatophagoides pteronyssinus]
MERKNIIPVINNLIYFYHQIPYDNDDDDNKLKKILSNPTSFAPYWTELYFKTIDNHFTDQILLEVKPYLIKDRN